MPISRRGKPGSGVSHAHDVRLRCRCTPQNRGEADEGLPRRRGQQKRQSVWNADVTAVVEKVWQVARCEWWKGCGLRVAVQKELPQRNRRAAAERKRHGQQAAAALPRHPPVQQQAIADVAGRTAAVHGSSGRQPDQPQRSP